MRSFLANLFAAPTAPTTRTRLGVESMENRYAPALVVNPLVIRGFNPQPEPPHTASVLVSPIVTRGIIIEGG